MSKYYRVNDVSRAIVELQNAENGYSGSYDKAEILNVLEDLPIIEVSEDCISREWVKGICENMLDEEMLGHMLGYIENAPSVVPKAKKSEWIELGQNKDKTHNIRCKACGAAVKSRGHAKSFYTKERFRSCPHCGAKMKGAEE